MSRDSGRKGGAPKVFTVLGKDGKGATVIARSPKAARMIARNAGFEIADYLNGKAILPTDLDPKKAIDALNYRQRRDGEGR